MKQLLLLLFLSLLTQVKAQTINDIPLKDLDVEYLEIVGIQKFFGSKFSVRLDIGQFSKLISPRDELKIKDSNGERLDFNSMIDALNFMSINGYEFITAYIVHVDYENEYHYLMKKKK